MKKIQIYAIDIRHGFTLFIIQFTVLQSFNFLFFMRFFLTRLT